MQRAQRLVASGNNHVSGFQAAGDFDIRDAADSGLHWHEHGFAIANYEYALNIIVHWASVRIYGWLRSSQSHAAALLAILIRLKFLFGAYGKSLNRNGHYVCMMRRLNVGCAGEPGPSVFRRVVQPHMNFEVARFVAVRWS